TVIAVRTGTDTHLLVTRSARIPILLVRVPRPQARTCHESPYRVSIFEAVVLGRIQGLTEFMPVSSSAHMSVLAASLGWSDPGAAFTAVSQIGTELAVVIYFRKRIWAVLSVWFRSLANRDLRSDINARMGWYIILATIPIGVLGLLFEDQIDGAFRDLR